MMNIVKIWEPPKFVAVEYQLSKVYVSIRTYTYHTHTHTNMQPSKILMI